MRFKVHHITVTDSLTTFVREFPLQTSSMSQNLRGQVKFGALHLDEFTEDGTRICTAKTGSGKQAIQKGP